ncbi:unnamed protein product [Cylicostephanus goldi]|uniref:Poly [ADP-ribose] polymerase n=1 Tax=Cylicostephanus goldi TaxID=71465 RepID=A0A3P6SLW3_CYLGO|nr:unnamed protein product [Cylicostephanus goldi]
MLLCDVALGKIKPEKNAQMHSLETIKGYNSVQGIGATQPDPSDKFEMEDGCVIVKGKPVDDNRSNHCLFYNEFIVYDVDQIRMRYLLRLRFKSPH